MISKVAEFPKWRTFIIDSKYVDSIRMGGEELEIGVAWDKDKEEN